MYRIQLLYKNGFQGENIRDILWDTSTEIFGENKGRKYWALRSVPY